MTSALDKFLLDYDGHPLKMEDLIQYDRDALNLFTDENEVSDPYLIFNFTHDITSVKKAYELQKSKHPEATLTSYLLWAAARSICEIPHFSWRKFGNTWYEFKNLPFFMPVATGGDPRMSSILLKNVKGCSFKDFVKQYSVELGKAKKGLNPGFIPADLFFLAHRLNNLPNIRFTSMKSAVDKMKSTRVQWTFGQRYEQNGSMLVPVMVCLHHSNGDPVLLKQMLDIFDSLNRSFVN